MPPPSDRRPAPAVSPPSRASAAAVAVPQQPIDVAPLAPTHPLLTGGMHDHPSYAIVYIASGAGVLRTPAAVTAVEAGDVVVVAPGERVDARGLATAAGAVVSFSASALDPGYSDADLVFPSALPRTLRPVAIFRFASTHLAAVRVPPGERGDWEARLERMTRELAARPSGFEDVVRSELCVLLVTYSRLAAERVATRAEGVHCALLGDVFAVIDRKFQRPIALADVALAVGRSRAYLTDLVRRETGRTVGDWITERRMAAARRLLQESDLPVAEVGRSVSYTDAGYFIRLFRRHHGLTPAAWRRHVATGATGGSAARADGT